MAKKDHRRKGGKDFPDLETAKQFAYRIGKSEHWVRQACKEGRILACQLVGHTWVIATDTIIRPRYLEGLDNHLIDVDLPEDMVVGERVYVPPPPVYKMPAGNRLPKDRKKYKIPGFKRIMDSEGYTWKQVQGKCNISVDTIARAREGFAVLPKTVIKIAHGMDVDVSELLRR